jgi:anaphase-promoting complex subunit 4
MDGKIIGIAYSSGLVTLVDIESKDEIHSFVVKSDVTSICWTQNAVEIDESERSILDSHKTFLAPLPNINTGNKKVHYDSGKFYSKNMLNFLLVACTDAKIHIYIFGVLSCGSIDVAKDLEATETDEIVLLEVKLSTNFKELYVIYSKNGQVDLLVYENETLLKYHVPLWKLSVKYGMVLNILGYIEDTIQHLTEAWECVLLEMDKKLTKYAKEQPRGSVSADFLELLLFGYPSEALDHFLTQDLTEKELKKLGNSIELSYSTIQKLVVKPLHNAIVSLVYHVNGISGMQQNAFYYKDILGEVSNDAIINTGAFLIKSYELQQTIDKSMRDYKIFFRWLYIAITRLLDEASVPEDIGTINQQEINYLAEFLYNFEQNREESVDAGGETEVKFNLERVGQYLVDKDLIIPTKDNSSMWEQLLTENECLRSNVAIYPHHKKLSLIQQKNLMRKSIDELFGRLESTVGTSFKLQPKQRFASFKICEESHKVVTSHVIDSEAENVANMFTVLLSPDCLLLLVCTENSPTQTFELKFRNSDDCIVASVGQLSFVDAKFYNSKVISVLMKNQVEMKSYSCFMQLAVNCVTENAGNINGDLIPIDVYSLLDDTTYKVLEGLSGMTLAVSGSRNVAAILASNSKFLRLYDMEVEDDDADEDDSNLIET